VADLGRRGFLMVGAERLTTRGTCSGRLTSSISPTGCITLAADTAFYEEIALPRSVRDRVVVDTTPWVRPMLTVLEEYHRTCVLVVDKESARTWGLYEGEISETSKLFGALRKPQFAGWHGLEEYRVRNMAEELARRHPPSRNVLDDFFRAGRFELLAVGGHEFEESTFTEFLPRNLREAVAGTFSIDLVERYERDEERGWVSEVY
jgi:hypothetical protein